MFRVGGQLIEVNLHRSIVGARFAEPFELLARGEDVARADHRQCVGKMAIERGIDTVVLTPGYVNYRHVELLALDLYESKLAPDVAAARFGVGLAADEQMHLEMAGQSFQARGEVDGVADDR